jgi:predicted phage replisome organizer
MSDVHWIKILTDIFEDEKVKLIQAMPDGDGMIVLWFKLLTQAGKSNHGGYVSFSETMPYTPAMLSVLFGKSEQMVNYALGTFSNFKMIEIDNSGFIYITNWEKHQSVDKMNKIKEQTRVRVQNHREKQKALLPHNKEDVTQCNANVTHGNATDIELELELDLELDLKNKEKDLKNKKSVDANASKRFIKPNIQQIFEYCQERKNNVDPEKWFDHYESNGWKVGKNAMKDWKAAVRTWEKNSSTSISRQGGNYSTKTKKEESFDQFKSFAQQRFEEASRNEENRTNTVTNTDQTRLS